MKNKNLIICAIILVVIILIIYLIINANINQNKIGPLGSTHEHADFRVYINNEELDFAQARYMLRDKYVHVEDMQGNVIHKHATGITLDYFFESLGFKFNRECFVTEAKVKYCNKDDKTLKFYVNSEKNYDYERYEIGDNEKYLISYGNESDEEIQKQLDSI